MELPYTYIGNVVNTAIATITIDLPFDIEEMQNQVSQQTQIMADIGGMIYLLLVVLVASIVLGVIAYIITRLFSV